MTIFSVMALSIGYFRGPSQLALLEMVVLLRGCPPSFCLRFRTCNYFYTNGVQIQIWGPYISFLFLRPSLWRRTLPVGRGHDTSFPIVYPELAAPLLPPCSAAILPALFSLSTLARPCPWIFESVPLRLNLELETVSGMVGTGFQPVVAFLDLKPRILLKQD